MKVLLANPPWYEKANCENNGFMGVRAGSRWPHKHMGNEKNEYRPFPFFMAITGALLEKNGIIVDIRDSINLCETTEEYLEYVKQFNPYLIVQETSTNSLKYDLMIADMIKKCLPNTKICFTGIHAGLEEENFLRENNNIDYTIFGEYEYPVLELIEYLEGKRNVENVSSLIYRDGLWYKKNKRMASTDIKKLPWPNREFASRGYADKFCGLDEPQLQMYTSRGCPFHCNFCVWPQVIYGNHRYRMREVNDIIDEIKSELSKKEYRSIYFDDDAINVNKKHILELCKAMKLNNLNSIKWGCMCRADLMDDEILTALKEAGCVAVKYGVESFDQDVINKAGKGMDVCKNLEMIQRTRNIYKIRTHLTYCVGLLGDTRDTVERTLGKALEIDCDSAQFSIASPFPGSKLWDVCLENGWIGEKDYETLDGANKSIIPIEGISPEELEKMVSDTVEKANKKFSDMVPPEYMDEKKIKQWVKYVGKNRRILITCTTQRSRVVRIYNELEKENEVYILAERKWKSDLAKEIPENNIVLIRNGKIDLSIADVLNGIGLNFFDDIIIPIRGGIYRKDEYNNVREVLEEFGKISYIDEFADING